MIDEDDNVCESIHKVNYTYCSGSCSGQQHSSVRFVSRKKHEAEVVGYADECLCCRGVKGGEGEYDVTCGSHKKRKTISVDVFVSCQCEPCVSGRSGI